MDDRTAPAHSNASLAPQGHCPIKPADLRWLVRYARRGGFYFAQGVEPEHALRIAFGRPAWRVLCRTPRDRFMPILRNRDLSIYSLLTYCRRLAMRQFAVAPRAELLAFFLTQRRRYFDLPCRLPEEDDYLLIRLAEREARSVSHHELALVSNWMQRTGNKPSPRARWQTLIGRATQHQLWDQGRVLARAQAAGDGELWHFYGSETEWRGLRIHPLTSAVATWEESQAMGHCVYQIRAACSAPRPSRFFSIRRYGKRYATLELTWRPPQQGDIGMDREWGRWELRDLRLSYNRLPDQTLVQSMHDFAALFNAWSKRPSRMQGGEKVRCQENIARAHGRGWRPWPASIGAGRDGL